MDACCRYGSLLDHHHRAVRGQLVWLIIDSSLMHREDRKLSVPSADCHDFPENSSSDVLPSAFVPDFAQAAPQ